jgi:hypothetical protein
MHPSKHQNRKSACFAFMQSRMPTVHPARAMHCKVAGFGLVEAAQPACCASAVTIRKLKTTGTASRSELAGTIRKMSSGSVTWDSRQEF